MRDPLLMQVEKRQDRQKFQTLRRRATVRIFDTYTEQLEELFATRQPQLRAQPRALKREVEKAVQEHLRGRDAAQCGTWVFFPWSETLIHFLEEPLHQELRTARNKNLITHEEQEKFYGCTVAIAGLSVGSHAAASIVLQGGGRDMRLADLDTISGSNLNRIRSGFDSIGVNKAERVGQYIFETNPYASLRVYTQGIAEKTIRQFLTAPSKVDVLIEEMDDLWLKIAIRKEAKKLGIPVLMATDNGDGILLDIERYDLDPALPIMGGRGDTIVREQIRHASPEEKARLITQFIDPRFVSQRMLDSVKEVGHSLYSWPQLGGAAQLAGVVLAYATRMIATGSPLKSGRTRIALEDLLSG